MYTANNKHINNLVTNYNPKNINGKSNTNTTTDSKLLKPAKCAYIWTTRERWGCCWPIRLYLISLAGV